MIAPSAAHGFLITFRPCGHVLHWHTAPAVGAWISCSWAPVNPGCQTQRQVKSVSPCPGCPDCWKQPALFEMPGRAA